MHMCERPRRLRPPPRRGARAPRRERRRQVDADEHPLRLSRADEGGIVIGGTFVDFHSTRDAIARGIGMVHQHFSVGQQQRVEILKALYRGAEILILDEPTAVLRPQETTELFGILRSLTARGTSIVFISHKSAPARSSPSRAWTATARAS